MLREYGVQSNGATKYHRGIDRQFLNLYMTKYMWPSKLNNKNLFETIIKDIAEVWGILKASKLFNIISLYKHYFYCHHLRLFKKSKNIFN